MNYRQPSTEHSRQVADAAGAELESLVASCWFYPPTDTHTRRYWHMQSTQLCQRHTLQVKNLHIGFTMTVTHLQEDFKRNVEGYRSVIALTHTHTFRLASQSYGKSTERELIQKLLPMLRSISCGQLHRLLKKTCLIYSVCEAVAVTLVQSRFRSSEGKMFPTIFFCSFISL